MKIIPDRCPRCLAAPRFECSDYTLYLCGSVISREAGKDITGAGCVAGSATEVKLLERL